MLPTNKKRELLGILAYFLIVSFIIASLKLGYVAGIMLYLVTPAIYLTIRKPLVLRKAAIFSAVVSAPMVLVFNYIATVSQAWVEVTASGIRILGTFPIETFLWTFFYVYFIISFYEYFFDGNRGSDRVSHHIKQLIAALLLLVIAFGLIFSLKRELLVIEYFYIYFAIGLFVIPPVVVVSRNPWLLQKIIYQGLYFLLLTFMYEIAAGKAGHWYFPGNYIGFVEIIGYRFPFEELLWLVFCVPSTIAIYEVFADDRA